VTLLDARIKYSPFDVCQMVDNIGWLACTDTAMLMKVKANVAQNDYHLDLELNLQVPDRILALRPGTTPGRLPVDLEVSPYMPCGSRILLSWDYNTGFDSSTRIYMEGSRIYPESSVVSRRSWYFGDMIRQIVAKITKMRYHECAALHAE